MLWAKAMTAIMAWAASATAVPVEISWDQEVAFEYDRESYQKALREIVEQSYVLLSAELGLALRQTVHVKIDTRAHFEQQFGTAAAWVEAAHYSREVIYINGGSKLDDRFAGYVVHEMTHALFDYQGTAGRLPTWLNEGVAERFRWKRMGLEDLSPNQIAELKQAHQAGALIPLPRSGPLSQFGYLQCYAAVLFLEKRVGKGPLLSTVRRTLDGQTFERALDREIGWSTTEVEREFASWVEHL